MIIQLNEYTLALLCGGISCLTYLLTTTFSPSYGKSVRIQDGAKKKTRKTKTILKATNSETNDSPDDEEEEEDDVDDQSSKSEKLLTRRQSYNRSKIRRSDSVRSDHVIFADEITADDEKFSPIIDDFRDEMIEGILSKSEDEGHLTVNFEMTEVEELNHFDEIHPLDDHDLLIRRRSLHSTPSGSHRGSKTNLTSELDQDDKTAESEGKLKAELSGCRERITVLETELAEIEEVFSLEKREIEEVIAKAGLDKSDLTGSVKNLHHLLQSALNQLYPDMPKDDQGEALLAEYVEKQAFNNTH